MTKLRNGVTWLLTHQAALTITVLTSVLTLVVGKLGLDLDPSAIALAIVAQLGAGLGIRQAVYSKATATTLATDAYVAGAYRPVPQDHDQLPIPPDVLP